MFQVLRDHGELVTTVATARIQITSTIAESASAQQWIGGRRGKMRRVVQLTDLEHHVTFLLISK